MRTRERENITRWEGEGRAKKDGKGKRERNDCRRMEEAYQK